MQLHDILLLRTSASLHSVSVGAHCPPDNVRLAGGYIMQMYNIILLRTSVNLRFFVPYHSIISCTSHSVFLFIHMLLVCCLFFRLHDLY